MSISSTGNLYRFEGPYPNLVGGIKLFGGSGPPIPSQVQDASHNELSMTSEEDSIEGFGIGILANASLRSFAAAAPNDGNRVDLKLSGTTFSGDQLDLQLVSAMANCAPSTSTCFSAGNDNVISVFMRDLTDRSAAQVTTLLAPALNLGGVAIGDLAGQDNRLEIR
jgi:hypothetical protein